METTICTSDKLFMEVAKKLHAANIILIEEESVPASATLDEIIMHPFASEMMQRHVGTVSNFGRYCYYPLHKCFFDNEPVESVDMVLVCGALAGYGTGIQSRIAVTQNGKFQINSVIEEKISGIFSERKLKEIGNCVKRIAVALPGEAEAAYQWMKQDVSAQETQLGSAVEFFEGLKGRGREKADKQELKQLAQKVIDTCMFYTGDTSHCVWMNQKREQLGILTPPRQLLQNIEYMLVFLDILYYSKCLNMNSSDDPAKIEFVCF